MQIILLSFNDTQFQERQLLQFNCHFIYKVLKKGKYHFFHRALDDNMESQSSLFITFGLFSVLRLLLFRIYGIYKKKTAGFPYYNILPYIVYFQVTGKISKDNPINHGMYFLSKTIYHIIILADLASAVWARNVIQFLNVLFVF